MLGVNTSMAVSIFCNFVCSKLERIPISDYLDSKSEVDKSHSLDVKRELTMLTLPAIGGQALDPLAQLMETAYIGRLGRFDVKFVTLLFQ